MEFYKRESYSSLSPWKEKADIVEECLALPPLLRDNPKRQPEFVNIKNLLSLIWVIGAAPSD